MISNEAFHSITIPRVFLLKLQQVTTTTKSFPTIASSRQLRTIMRLLHLRHSVAGECPSSPHSSLPGCRRQTELPSSISWPALYGRKEGRGSRREWRVLRGQWLGNTERVVSTTTTGRERVPGTTAVNIYRVPDTTAINRESALVPLLLTERESLVPLLLTERASLLPLLLTERE